MAKHVLERTCWRGVQVDHPAVWEASVASGPQEGGRLTFVDRRFTRLDLRWRHLKYVPNMDDLLDRSGGKDKKTDDQGVTTAMLGSAPPDWRGLVRTGGQGAVVNAGRFFEDQRLLVEAAIIWPKDRDKDLERQILESVTVHKTDAPARHWRALGIDAQVDRQFELVQNNAQVGRVNWMFQGPAKHTPPQLMIERLAMVDCWLKEPLSEWIVSNLPLHSQVLRDEEISFNRHSARRLLSQSKVGTVSALTGRRMVRVDVAWQCEQDLRLYHIAYGCMARRGTELELPVELRVDCCRSAPVVK